ncbi:hypothetical protein ACLMJK_000213 [Lecanora helva]
MTASFRQSTSEDVVGKVLRRAEVAKMARKLQDRLALASYKTQHGQESLSFDDVEARLEKSILRKRPSSSVGTASTSSSSAAEPHLFSGGVASSPLTAPFSSDDFHDSGVKRSFKRNIYQSTSIEGGSKSSKRIRSQSMAPPLFESSRASWKSSHNLPESSPGYNHKHSDFSISHGPNLSFASEVSTIPSSPPFGHGSDAEDSDFPKNSFSMNSDFQDSLPRTPPPTRSRSVRQRKAGGEEGADLLLYLATSPSPANPGNRSSRMFAPSTPPSKTQALPSSMMTTPGMTGFSTPGQHFNFADFVNVTPSPAQGAFGNRTPGPTRTPLAAREARRRLNFDTLAPPSGSPNLSNVGRGSIVKDSGLGMELGGELVSSQ